MTAFTSEYSYKWVATLKKELTASLHFVPIYWKFQLHPAEWTFGIFTGKLKLVKERSWVWHPLLATPTGGVFPSRVGVRWPWWRVTRTRCEMATRGRRGWAPAHRGRVGGDATKVSKKHSRGPVVTFTYLSSNRVILIKKGSTK